MIMGRSIRDTKLQHRISLVLMQFLDDDDDDNLKIHATSNEISRMQIFAVAISPLKIKCFEGMQHGQGRRKIFMLEWNHTLMDQRMHSSLSLVVV